MPKTLSRREALAALAASTAFGAGARYRALLGAQCYVWTQVFAARKKSLGDGLEEMFAGTRRAGYSRMELMSQMFTPELRAKTAGLMKSHRIQAPVVYVGGAMHEASAAEQSIRQALEIADVVRPLGTGIIDTNPNPKPKRERKTDAELDVQAKYVNRLARSLADRRMKLILHHHDPEMAEGAREWRHLLKNTDPGLVGLCIDIDWVIRGGQKPLEILEEAGARTAALHLRNSRAGVWTQSLDDGEYDYAAVARFLRASGFDGYLFVELAHEKGTGITRSLEENLRLSRAFARKTFQTT